ncbi:MAG: acyl-CoA mutase large subunit family protein [Verrucomicrobiales bacterium]|nr:acyl-CoA mutase large subunit family protein [Verrucomicrobiales bacterium]
MKSENPTRLLSEFPPVTMEHWRTLVEAELKGAPFDKKMFSATHEGVTLRPLYVAEDLAKLTHLGALPGSYPFVRGTSSAGFAGRPWEVSQEIAGPSPTEFNDAAHASLARGVTALNLVLDRATRQGADPDSALPEEVGAGGVSLSTLDDLVRAFEGLDWQTTPVFVRSGASAMPFAALLVALARRRGWDLAQLRGCIEMDPLGVLAHEGRLAQSLDAAYREMASLTQWAATHAPRLQTVCVHGRAWHEAGGQAVQELAFTLAMAVEYLREMTTRGLAVRVVAPRVRLAFTVGSQFFMEIAKLRAARMLWAKAVSVLGGDDAAQRASLHVRTAHFNKTRYDAHVNLLRTTVESLAAVLGGCDSLQVGRFDEVLRGDNEFAQRVARNQQLLLKHECHLAGVADPAGGSWYVESLTAELAEKAWAMFQEIERQGGMHRAMAAGWPQAQVEAVQAKRREQVERRRESVVGVNVYANPTESMPESPAVVTSGFAARRAQQVAAYRTASDDARHHEVLGRLAEVVGQSDASLFEACVAAASAGASLGEISRAVRIKGAAGAVIRPVVLTRLSEGYERLREAVDAHVRKTGRRPVVFLANLGPLRQHKARADFSRSFFEVAGLHVINPPGFKGPEDAAATAISAGAEAMCICSTDETYPELVPPLVRAVRAQSPGVLVLLAGYPPDQVEAHKASGVDDFIHVRANALSVLTAVARRLGVQV